MYWLSCSCCCCAAFSAIQLHYYHEHSNYKFRRWVCMYYVVCMYACGVSSSHLFWIPAFYTCRRKYCIIHTPSVQKQVFAPAAVTYTDRGGRSHTQDLFVFYSFFLQLNRALVLPWLVLPWILYISCCSREKNSATTPFSFSFSRWRSSLNFAYNRETNRPPHLSSCIGITLLWQKKISQFVLVWLRRDSSSQLTAHVH